MEFGRLFLFAFTLAAVLAASTTQAQTTYRWTDKDGKVSYSDKPPPGDARNVQEKKLGAPNSVATSGPSYSVQRAQQAYPVTLYSSGDCLAECATARDYLKRRAIPFREKIIKTPDDANDFKKITGIDELAVPTLRVGDQVEKGYLEQSWDKLLDAAGYRP